MHRIICKISGKFYNFHGDSGGPPRPSPLGSPALERACRDAETTLGGVGRVLLRASGTEPVIRVMAEGEDEAAVDAAVNGLCETIATLTRRPPRRLAGEFGVRAWRARGQGAGNRGEAIRAGRSDLATMG